MFSDALRSGLFAVSALLIVLQLCDEIPVTPAEDEGPRENPTGFLTFPLKSTGTDQYSAAITAVLDHSLPVGNCTDGMITTYDNIVALPKFGESSWSVPSTCGGEQLRGYKFEKTTLAITRLNYIGYDTLFYDGHTGYDYRVSDETPVYPAADGIAYSYSATEDDPFDVMIVHEEGYTTFYIHLISREPWITEAGIRVTTDIMIGRTGKNHLHLTVKKGNQRVDPYGWLGPVGKDPLKVDGKDNTCLWRECR